MNKWLLKFMEKPDISDKFELLDKKMENMHGVGPDKTDKFDPNVNMSVLSGRAPGLLDEKKVENNPSKGGDKSDRFKFESNMSPLSLRPRGLLDENLENMSKTKPDITDKTNAGDLLSGSHYGLFGKTAFTFSNGSDLLDEYEERLAIAEHDGHQSSLQAKRMAYLDSFIAVFVTLPYDDMKEDWLAHRIRAAQEWLVDQGITQPR